MEQNEYPDKASVVRFLLETEGRVMLCLDATQTEVDVPRRFCRDNGLMLAFNSLMPQPIHILPDSIASELRFGGIPHYCVVPFKALWAAFNPDTNRGMVWPDAIPGDIVDTHNVLQIRMEEVHLSHIMPESEREAEATTGNDDEDHPEDLSLSKVSPPFLRVIDGGGTNTPAPSNTTNRRPNLRLVK